MSLYLRSKFNCYSRSPQKYAFYVILSISYCGEVPYLNLNKSTMLSRITLIPPKVLVCMGIKDRFVQEDSHSQDFFFSLLEVKVDAYTDYITLGTGH